MEQLEIFQPLVAEIAIIRKEAEATVFDYNDPKGNREARSFVAKLRKSKKPINDAHKAAKAEALALSKKLDSAKRELIEELDAIIDIHDAPIQAIINAEKEAAAKIEAERVAELERRERELAEREAAIKAEEMKKAQEKREAEIAEEAARNAKAQAEAEIIRKQQAEVADRQRREADKEHRRNINSRAVADIMLNSDLNTAQATDIVRAIIKGAIANIKISY